MKKLDLALGIGGGLAGGIALVYLLVWGAEKVGNTLDPHDPDTEVVSAPILDGPVPGVSYDITAADRGTFQVLLGYRIVGRADQFDWPNGAQSWDFHDWLVLEGPDGHQAFLNTSRILVMVESEQGKDPTEPE